MNEEDDRYRAPALDKGLDILELLAATADGLSQAEIAKALQRTPNEFYRMLDRLVRRGYVRRNAGDRYELSLKLFELAHQRPPMHRMISQAMPVLRRFAQASEQAVHLVVRDRNILVVVAQVDGPGYWNLSIRVGSRMGLLNTGSGHVFLAYSSLEERRMMLEGQDIVADQITDQLNQRLAQVRTQGYENLPSAQVSGVLNLSVPILGPLGTIVAAITCPYTQRLDKADAASSEAALSLLQRAGREISQGTDAP